MTSYVTFTALSGVKSDDPPCYLLGVDNVRILLDCGSTDVFPVTEWKALERVAPQIDLVLLSHPTVEHLGAYVYAYTRLQLQCPVYGTMPLVNMGQIALQDLLLSRRSMEPFDLFTMEDINRAFQHITTLRYHQPIPLTEKCQGITITAFSAGHTIGGTLWKVSKDTEDIVYAVDYNHTREKHLNGSDLLHQGVIIDTLCRPSLLITSAHNALVTQPSRKQRDASFAKVLHQTLTAGHNVLIPTDSSARVLELCYMLDQLWETQRYTFPVFFLTHRSYRTVAYAKTMLEWMSDTLTERFANARENPFDLPRLQLVHRLDQVTQRSGPKVVLASLSSLETGFARDLLVEWAEDPHNLILLPQRGPPSSLAHNLYQTWCEQGQQDSTQSNPNEQTVTLAQDLPMSIKRKVKLVGAELERFMESERQRKEKEASENALRARHKTIMEGSDSENSEAEIDDTDIEQLVFRQPDVYIRDTAGMDTTHNPTQMFRMFPYIERRKRFDDYGEIINPEQYKQNTMVTQDGVLMYGPQRAADPGKRDGKFTGEVDETEEEEPFKYITESITLALRCQLLYLNYEGLSDGRSIVNLLTQWGMKKLVLVQGNQDATNYLAQTCLINDQITDDVFTPNLDETLSVASGSMTVQVTMTDALLSSLNFSTAGDYQFAHVTGQFLSLDPETRPSLDALPVDQSRPWHRPVFIGNAKLTVIRRLLEREGYTTDFREEGVLVCNNKVAIRKTEGGRFLLEGVFCPEYYRVRDIVYRQHAMC
ncbi:hypothetical protein IWQ61_001983 [Dispira simplex]|nr:hypothetical protein IWQ61_001983 [Dispira simplex]